MKTLTLAIFCLVVCGEAQAQDLPPGKGAAIVNGGCSDCHSAERVTSAAPMSKADWQNTVERMMSKGMDLKPEDEAVLLTYLAKYFGESVNLNTASVKVLQEQLDLTAGEADAIAKARAAMPFKTLADLGKVSGLDAGKLEPFKARLVFE